VFIAKFSYDYLTLPEHEGMVWLHGEGWNPVTVASINLSVSDIALSESLVVPPIVEPTVETEKFIPALYVLLPEIHIASPPSQLSLTVTSDKAICALGEMVTLTATLLHYGIGVYNVTVLFEIVDPYSNTINILAARTDLNGVATVQHLTLEGDPVGNYTVYASAYLPYVGNATTSTAFQAAYLEPHLAIQFDYSTMIAVINQDLTVGLTVKNIGNGTAYNVNITMDVPEGVNVVSSDLPFTETIDPGENITLTVTVNSFTPGAFTFTAKADYTKIDGTPMPTATDECTVLYTYHPDYPVDIQNITVTIESGSSSNIYVTFNLTNFGDTDITITLIASAQHLESKYSLRSRFETVVIPAHTTLTYTLPAIYMPTTAPSGDYLIQTILATGLPRSGGFALTYVETVITI